MHSPDDDFYLGRYVLEQKLVAREALLECLYQTAQERRAGARPGFARPLGVRLVENGLLTDEDLNRILASRVSAAEGRALSEAEVGKLLVASGLMTPEDVERCVAEQRKVREGGGSPPRLGEMAVKRGYATEQQVMRVLAYQKRVVMACSGCGVRVSAALPPPGTHYRCRRCGAAIAPVDDAGADVRSMREADVGEDAQLDIDRAVSAYLRQKDLVRRDQLRESQHLQSEFARYGLVVPLAELLRRAEALTWEQQRELAKVDFRKIVQDAEWKQQTVPGYKVLAAVASGAFATIYAAEPVFGGAKVAVKLLHPERAKDERSVKRFQQEAELLRKIESSYIVRGSEYGAEGDRHFVVMEYVDGRSLGQSLSDLGAFAVRAAVQTARQVAAGLDDLHAAGYAHRDIRTDNVLIDRDGRVKLCDLGFAEALPADAAAAGRLRAADFYALGLLFYGLLTGHEPYGGSSSEETSEAGDLPVPNLMMVSAPAPVVALLKRLMHPDEKKRFAAATEVIAALDGAGRA